MVMEMVETNYAKDSPFQTIQNEGQGQSEESNLYNETADPSAETYETEREKIDAVSNDGLDKLFSTFDGD